MIAILYVKEVITICIAIIMLSEYKLFVELHSTTNCSGRASLKIVYNDIIYVIVIQWLFACIWRYSTSFSEWTKSRISGQT